MPLGARELWGCSTCSSLGAVPRWVSWGFLAHAHSLSLEGPPCRGWSCCHLRVGTACGPDRRSLSRLRSPRLSSGSLCALRLVQTGPPGTRRGRRGARLPGAQSKRSCFLRPCFLSYLFTAGMRTPHRHPTLARGRSPSVLRGIDADIFSHIRGMFLPDLIFLLSPCL